LEDISAVLGRNPRLQPCRLALNRGGIPQNRYTSPDIGAPWWIRTTDHPKGCITNRCMIVGAAHPKQHPVRAKLRRLITATAPPPAVRRRTKGNSPKRRPARQNLPPSAVQPNRGKPLYLPTRRPPAELMSV
jgi:hypothetical protein